MAGAAGPACDVGPAAKTSFTGWNMRFDNASMSPDSLHHSRIVSTAAIALLSMWLFGNLYEAVVTGPDLVANPQPGSFPDAFAAGSPVYYYIPWGPLGVAALVTCRVRYGAAVSATVRRMWSFAIVALGLGLAVKAVLIVGVNPVLRDPDRPDADIPGYATLWCISNGIAVLATASALLLFCVCRRPAPDQP